MIGLLLGMAQALLVTTSVAQFSGGLPATVHAAWGPVTTDTLGNPLTVDHYTVTLDATPPQTVLPSACTGTPVVCISPSFQIVDSNAHTISVFASTTLVDGAPTTTTFTIVVPKAPASVTLQKGN